MKRVVIGIPMYKEHLDEKDRVSLTQLNRVLGRYPRVFVMPESLRPKYGALGRGVRIERFPDAYFRGTLGYSSLLLSDEFYARFADYEYLLIYQTDAFVFHDALSQFCAMGYDYIGAPVGRMDTAWHVLGMTVGNGGFSLRRVVACRRVLRESRAWLAQHPFREAFLRWEDMFFSYCSTQKAFGFRVPDVRTALAFAVQDNVSHVYQRMEHGWQPFGCHGWDKLRFEGLKAFVEQASGHAFPAFTEKDRQAFRVSFCASHRYRTGVDVLPLIGFVRGGELAAMESCLLAMLARYPDGDPAWEGKAEVFSLLWRRVRMKELEGEADAPRVLRGLEAAMCRACGVGEMTADMTEEVFLLLPQLPCSKTTARLRRRICDVKWRQWEGAAHYAAPYAGPKGKSILVAAWCENEAAYVESFVRHTLSFADGILVNIHASQDESRTLLEKLQAEGCAVEWLDRAMTFSEFCALVRSASDADFVLGLPVHGFLLPMPGSTIRGTLEALNPAQAYDVPARFYAPLHEDLFQDKWLLARALVRDCSCAPRTVLYGRNSTGAPRMASLELACFTHLDRLKNPETVDLAPFVERQVNQLDLQ